MMSSTSPVDLETSVAGEEDPGASTEIGSAMQKPAAPGDEACPDCGGSGQRAGRACTTCGGTGKVTRARQGD